MLMNCPKCGFSQPKDRYCANCGIDMEAFKPNPPSVSAQLMNNPVFYLAIAIALLSGSIFYISKSRRQEMITRMEYLRGNPVIVESEPMDIDSTQVASRAEPPVTEKGAPAASAQSSPESLGGANLARSAQVSNTSAGGSIAASDSVATADPSRAEKIHVTVSYLEMNKKDFEQATKELTFGTNFGQIRNAQIENAHKWVSAQKSRVIKTNEKEIDIRSRGTETLADDSLDGKWLSAASSQISINRFDATTADGRFELALSFVTSSTDSNAPPEQTVFPAIDFRDFKRSSGWLLSLTPSLPDSKREQPVLMVILSFDGQ